MYNDPASSSVDLHLPCYLSFSVFGCTDILTINITCLIRKDVFFAPCDCSFHVLLLVHASSVCTTCVNFFFSSKPDNSTGLEPISHASSDTRSNKKCRYINGVNATDTCRVSLLDAAFLFFLILINSEDRKQIYIDYPQFRTERNVHWKAGNHISWTEVTGIAAALVQNHLQVAIACSQGLQLHASLPNS